MKEEQDQRKYQSNELGWKNFLAKVKGTKVGSNQNEKENGRDFLRNGKGRKN